MRLSTAVERFLQWMRLEQKAEITVTGYKSDLHLLVSLAETEIADSVLAFTPEIVRLYFLKASEKNRTLATLGRKRAALNEFARFGLRERYWIENPMAAAPRFKKPKRLPRPFAPDEIERIMAVALPLQDRALRALLYYTGLRATPISRLRIIDLSFSPTTFADGLTVPGTVRAISKGNKESIKPMHPELWSVLRDYYLERMAKTDPRLFTRAYLFEQKGTVRAGQGDGRSFNRKVLVARTRKWGEAARVEKCIPHRFRHTFGTDLLGSGADIRLIQRLMDHEDIATTALYLKVRDAGAAQAVLKLRSFGAPGGSVMSDGSVPSGDVVGAPEQDAANAAIDKGKKESARDGL